MLKYFLTKRSLSSLTWILSYAISKNDEFCMIENRPTSCKIYLDKICSKISKIAKNRPPIYPHIRTFPRWSQNVKKTRFSGPGENFDFFAIFFMLFLQQNVDEISMRKREKRKTVAEHSGPERIQPACRNATARTKSYQLFSKHQ